MNQDEGGQDSVAALKLTIAALKAGHEQCERNYDAALAEVTANRDSLLLRVEETEDQNLRLMNKLGAKGPRLALEREIADMRVALELRDQELDKYATIEGGLENVEAHNDRLRRELEEARELVRLWLRDGFESSEAHAFLQRTEKP